MTEIMTLSEFEQAIDEWGNNWGIETEVSVIEHWINVCVKKGEYSWLVATISSKFVNVFDFSLRGTFDLKNEMRKPLLEIVIKFANTKPADRKDEKKFRITFDFDADADWSAEDVEILVKESLSTVYPFRKFMQYLKVEEEDA